MGWSGEREGGLLQGRGGGGGGGGQGGRGRQHGGVVDGRERGLLCKGSGGELESLSRGEAGSVSWFCKLRIRPVEEKKENLKI